MSSIRLGEIGKISMCKRILKSQTNEFSGIPFYKISTFGGTPTVYIDEKIYREYKEKYSYPKKGDILISAAGTIGKTVIFNGEDSYFQDSNIVWIENDESKVTNQFLYYFLQTNPFITTNGSTIKRLYNDNLRDTTIPNVPSIQKQNQITNLLGTLDKKIQNNNQINKELEAMAKTLYDYWFVQFDFPDQNGKPYKSSGGKMVYNPELKREIPEGWGVEKLGDVAYLKAGGDKPNNISDRKSKETPIPIYSNGLDNKGLYGYTNKATIYNNSLTVSARGTIGYVQRRFSPFFPIIRLISITPKEEKLIGYIENFLKSIQFENSGSVQQQLTVPQIDKLYIVIPENKLLEQYHSLTINYYCQVENNEQQNQELTQLRDWLLPMLMNGQVKVEVE